MSPPILLLGDCLNGLRLMPESSVDSIVTDPPYGLSFMGKKWDYDVPSVEIWAECLRVLKPGGHLLAFAGTRTQHRMAVRIEDAGFDIRDMIAWVYGSGFPKSLDVSKAIDKAAARTPAVGTNSYGDYSGQSGDVTAPATDAARQWQGWGTALKPALEPITVARKPLIGTVAANVLEHGTGALNVDGCRVATSDRYSYPNGAGGNSFSVGADPDGSRTAPVESNAFGRWPANLVHDGSDEVLAGFPDRQGVQRDAGTGSAARFFYCAKTSKADRNGGMNDAPSASAGEMTGGRAEGSRGLNSPRAGAGRTNGGQNHHPTVKPTDLMAYLCRLVTPPGGTVLDPFMGSGSTGKAALQEGFQFIGFEQNPEYYEIAKQRVRGKNT